MLILFFLYLCIPFIKIAELIGHILFLFALPAAFTVKEFQGSPLSLKFESAPTIKLLAKLLLWTNPLGWALILASGISLVLSELIIQVTTTLYEEIKILQND